MYVFIPRSTELIQGNEQGGCKLGSAVFPDSGLGLGLGLGFELGFRVKVKVLWDALGCSAGLGGPYEVGEGPNRGVL